MSAIYHSLCPEGMGWGICSELRRRTRLYQLLHPILRHTFTTRKTAVQIPHTTAGKDQFSKQVTAWPGEGYEGYFQYRDIIVNTK